MAAFSSTKQVIDSYNNGMDGILFDERKTDEILASMPNPLFGGAAGDGVKDSGKGKMALLHKLVQEFDPLFGADEAQRLGDCTSMGTRNACTVSLVCDIKARFEAETYPGRLATEAIYGARRHASEGMAVIFAVEYLQQKGIALRKKYGPYDLTQYNPSVGDRWGATGTPKIVTDETKNNTIQAFSLIQTVDEARDSLYNGYGITLGSNYGFGNQRDKNGISRKSGKWGHCMAWVSMDDTKQRSSETLILVQNSWGPNWITGPLVLDQPEGSFWITATDAQGMLNQKQGFAISNVNGFPARDIDWDSLYQGF